MEAARQKPLAFSQLPRTFMIFNDVIYLTNWKGDPMDTGKALFFWVVLLACLPTGSVAVIAGERPRTAAVFDFELIDTSYGGKAVGVDPSDRSVCG